MKTSILSLLAALILFASLPANAQEAEADGQDPKAVELLAQIRKAYAETKTYQSDIIFSIVRKTGRWDMIQRGDLHVAFDREQRMFTLDKPDIRVVMDNGLLQLTAVHIPGKHLEVDIPETMDYEAVSMELPYFSDPHVPDATFFLAEDPIQVASNYSGDEMKYLPPVDDDPQKRPGLQVEHLMGTLTFRVDPESHLITSARYLTPGIEEGAFDAHEFEITITKHNKPLDQDAFKFDAGEDSLAVGSLRELMTGGFAQRVGPDGDGEQMNQAHPLEGQQAKQFKLEGAPGHDAFSLEDAKEKVIILDFWATWCGPCLEGLPKLQKVNDWVKDEEMSVKIVAVNLREGPREVKAFLEDTGLTLPVIMDVKGTVGQAYNVEGIPQTVVISGGVIQHIYVGLVPGLEEKLKQNIRDLISDAAANAE